MDDMTIGDVLARLAATTPDKQAIVSSARTLTYAEFDAAIGDAVRRLLALGVMAGDRVAWLGRNHPSHLILFGA
jgi:fatty-acyl-CoA synthase